MIVIVDTLYMYMYVLILSYSTSIIYVRIDSAVTLIPSPPPTIIESLHGLQSSVYGVVSPLDQTFSLMAFRITCICSESGTAHAHVTDKMNAITFTTFNQIYMNRRFHRLKSQKSVPYVTGLR